MDVLSSLWSDFTDSILSLLPNSPFQPYIQNLGSVTWLKSLNWFIPIGTLIAIGSAWLVAIGIYYLYMVILRWVKVVGD